MSPDPSRASQLDPEDPSKAPPARDVPEPSAAGTNHDDDDPGADDEFDALAEVIDIDQLMNSHLQNRLWLRAVLSLLQLRSQEVDPNQRVQFALDQMSIAACERICRLLRSDLVARED
jgi:hypothetical protein